MHTTLGWIREQWPCISTAGLLGFLLGAVFTRRVMAPSFCPNCLQQKEWLKEFRKATPDQKAKSRFFFHLRRKDKDGPQ
jgi:hypothetical protein